VNRDWTQAGLFLGLTFIGVGYFMVWLSHGAAGLSYTGLELGEQAKFLPQVRSGALTTGRSLFYVPPIVLAVVLLLLSSQWPANRWQTWVMRVIGVVSSLLAVPAFEAIGGEPEEWLWRALMITVVVVLAFLTPFIGKMRQRFISVLIAMVALAGAVLPMWALFEVRGAFSTVYQASIGIGAGAWLYLLGQLLVASSAMVRGRSPSPAR
jgi:hypothetical protein